MVVVRVVIGEDEVLLREGLAQLLRADGFDVVAQAGDADDLLRKVAAHHPDVVIADVRMPPGNADDGLRAAIEIRRRMPDVGVLLLSQHLDENYAMELIGTNAAGVGYLLKDRVGDVGVFTDAIRRVADGGSALDPEVVEVRAPPIWAGWIECPLIDVRAKDLGRLCRYSGDGRFFADPQPSRLTKPTLGLRPQPSCVASRTGHSRTEAEKGRSRDMFASGRRRLLLLAVCAFAVLGPTALAAATGSSKSSTSCAPPAFTGSVRAHTSACVPPPGTPGLLGPRGPRGYTGATGHAGKVGRRGPKGSEGIRGDAGVAGAIGSAGPVGPAGPVGATGPTPSSVAAEFFALMPPDNSATVAAGTAVAFPENGPTSGTIVRLGSSTFELPDIGTYRVSFSVPVSQPGQLVIDLNAAQLPYTVYGRATGTSPIAGSALVQTTTVDSVLSVDNPLGESTALTITPLAGGTDPDVASLVIEELN